MKRTTMLLAAMLAGATGCDEKAAPGAPKTAETAAPKAPTAATAAAPSAAPSAAPPTEAPAPSFTGPVKVYDCGSKGQKPCPMQGWMKTVMASAASSGEGDKLAQALIYAAARVPPGYTGWAEISNVGATKARAGDIDGAKASCKQCHDLYKDSYKVAMRDRAW